MKQGQFFEALVKLIYDSLKKAPNFKVLKNHKIKNKWDREREFDVVIMSNVGKDKCVVIECKDYKRAVPVKEIEAFAGKCQRVPGISRKIFVSKNGFQADAINAAEDFEIALFTLEELETQIIQEWVEAISLGEISMESTFSNIQLSVHHSCPMNIGENIRLFIEGTEDGGVGLYRFVESYLDEDKVFELKKMVFHAYTEQAKKGISISELTTTLDIPFNSDKVYIKVDSDKHYVKALSIDLKVKINTHQLSPDATKNFVNFKNKIGKSELMSFLSKQDNKRITAIRQTDNKSHVEIMITDAKGDNLPFNGIPEIYAPEGIEVTIKKVEK